MKNLFLLFVLLFSSQFLFCQTEKGTFTFGTSHFSAYKSDRTHFFIDNVTFERNSSLQYGLFVKNNVLLSASLSYAPDVISLPNPVRGNARSLTMSYRRYFGKKRIKPFADAEIGVKLFRRRIFYQLAMQPGIALFLNSQTSLDLSFYFPVLNNDSFFPRDLRPEIGLALRFFLHYDKEQKTQISAKEMIKRGVLSADLSNSFLDLGDAFKNQLFRGDAGLKYFFLHNIYASAGFSMFTEKYPGIGVNRRDLSVRLGLGAYYPLGDFTALTIHAKGSRRLLKSERDQNTANFLEGQIQGGLALFFGRQKFELLTGFTNTKYESDNSPQLQSDNNFVISMDYEYFVFEQLSLNASISAFPENQRQRLSSNTLSNFRTIYNERFDLYLNLRLNWYIGSLKE